MQTQRSVVLERPALTFTSSDPELNGGFAWAVATSATWVRHGEEELASYWAGLTDRPLFYSRDVAHQLLGAHLLGLDEENLTMMRAFAASATESRGWYPLWSFDFRGAPGAIDYRSDEDFVRETPAVFELVEKAIEQYLWTGDRRWIEDGDLARYRATTLGAFTDANRRLGTLFAGADGTGDIFQGLASYNEAHDREHPQLAADGVAAQWAANTAVAATATFDRDRLQVDLALAESARRMADLIAKQFDDEWWSERDGRYASGRRNDSYDTGLAWEASTLPGVKGLMPHGTRADAHLDFLDQQLRATPPSNIEAATYYPELFLAYHHDDAAMHWIRYLLRSRATYPEVPFTLVAHLTTGLTGLRPVTENLIETDSHLADKDAWIDLRDVRVGDRVLDLRIDGKRQARLALHEDSPPIRWQSRLGDHVETVVVPPGEARVLSPASA